jgi:hypothetical protein
VEAVVLMDQQLLYQEIVVVLVEEAADILLALVERLHHLVKEMQEVQEQEAQLKHQVVAVELVVQELLQLHQELLVMEAQELSHQLQAHQFNMEAVEEGVLILAQEDLLEDLEVAVAVVMVQ